MFSKLIAGLAIFLLVACGEVVPPGSSARILLMGDSLMAANRSSGQSIAQVLEAELGEQVIDRSVIGARYFYPLPISGRAGLNLAQQYRPGKWSVVVLNGGGNDLLFGCGCGRCAGVLDRLVSPDARRGAIPELVAALRNAGARVIYTGYLRNPGVATVIKACGPAGNDLDRRLQRLDAMTEGFDFVPLADLVPSGDRSFHQADLIHPSAKGSRAIAARILPLILRQGGDPT